MNGRAVRHGVGDWGHHLSSMLPSFCNISSAIRRNSFFRSRKHRLPRGRRRGADRDGHRHAIDEVLTRAGRRAGTRQSRDAGPFGPWRGGIRIVSASIMTMTLDRSVVRRSGRRERHGRPARSDQRSPRLREQPHSQSTGRGSRLSGRAYKQQRVADAVSRQAVFGVQKE